MGAIICKGAMLQVGDTDRAMYCTYSYTSSSNIRTVHAQQSRHA